MSTAPQAASKPVAANLVWSVLTVLAACVLAVAFRTRNCLMDDAFIDFQYLNNLLAGKGFVFYPGAAPVEGVTNVGWVLALAPLSSVADPAVVAKLLGLALVLSTLILTASLGRYLAAKAEPAEESLGLVLVPILVLAVSFDFVYFSLSGMETALLAATLMLAACLVSERPASAMVPVLGAFAFLIHPEAVAVYPLYVLLRWSRRETDRRKLVAGAPMFAALLGGMTAVRYWYFHALLPNTYYSKPSDLRLAVENGYNFLMGQNTNVAFPVTGWLAIPVLGLGYVRLRRRAAAAADMMAAIGGVGLAFAIYSPPDWTNMARHFAPYLPAALMLLWAGVGEAVQLLCGASVRPRTRQSVAALVGLALVLTNISDIQTRLAQMDVFPGYVLAGKNLIEPAQWIRDHLPADATIATRRIGVLAYYSHRKVFDYVYGLADPEVARLVARHGRRFDLPTEQGLAALWRARAPDYLLEDGSVMDLIMARTGGAYRRFAIHGLAYRVVDKFTIGTDVQWVLAQRIGP
jgi:hypothetical protein